MEEPAELVKWLFLFLQTESAMLLRIEFLVVVIASLYLLMFILDLWRRRSRSSVIKYILLILDAIADSTFLYTTGLMQSAPFKKDLFPVWALVLVDLRFNGCFISAYGIPDQENRRISELSTVMALSMVAFLNGTRNSQFKHPIWAMWALQLVRSFYLIYAYVQAIGSNLHGRSSAFLTVSSATLNHADEAPVVNSTTMAGYSYPVCGDQKLKFQVEAPKYNFHLSTDHKTGLTTLEKVWNDGTLKNLSSSQNTDVELIRDMCMSFSMYRLLRCRFDNFSLPSNTVKETRDLMSTIMKDGPLRTFRIIESEVAFINDYFYTRYPVLFFEGFPLRATLHPLATIVFTCWLGRDIHRSYKPKPGETAHVIHGVNVDLIITWVFMGVVVLKEFWKMLTYLLSDWTKVTVLCWCIAKNSASHDTKKIASDDKKKKASLQKWLIENLVWLLCTPRFKIVQRWIASLQKWLIENLVWLLCTPRFKIVQRWHWKIDQYEFIQSYVYNPWKSNLFFYLSLGIIPKNAKGVKVGKAIKLPEEVKAAILKSICSMDLEKEFLNGDDLPSLNKARMEIRSEIEWAFKLSTCTHTILVWHIATSMCEIELAQHYNTSLTDSEVLRALKSAKGCCSSQSYIIKLQRLERVIRANFSVANSLSRYCAYMIAKVPDLLPDSSFVPELILQSTVEEASKILEGCDNLQSIYRRLMREGEMKGTTADDHLADNAEEQSKCCDLHGASCFLSLIKARAFRCFCSGNEGGNGRGGNRDTNRSDAVIDVGEDEDHILTAGDGDDTDDVVPSQERIITKGAQLGRLLIEKISDDVARWKLLSEVWADLLVHIAPSWNTDAHKKHLATGGEFITHVWAILSHCGVKSSKLWPEEVPVDDGAANQQPGASGNDQDRAQQQSFPPKARVLQSNSLSRPRQNQASLSNHECSYSKETHRRSERQAKPQEMRADFQYPDATKRQRPGAPSQCYLCTEEDNKTVKYIYSSKKATMVEISDVTLTKQKMQEDLLHPNGWVRDEIMNAYIYCLRDKRNPDMRAGGSVLLESTIVTSTIHESNHQPDWMKTAVARHFEHDMVFLPVNRNNNHWYLVVINGPHQEIQILDSLGPKPDGREELAKILKNLKEKYYNEMDITGSTWEDYNVTDWKLIEVFRESMQNDGSSCGLFVLHFMDHWTGDILSASITQEDVQNFRQKIADILVNHRLNKAKRSNTSELQTESEEEDPEGCEMLTDP